jgi:hypothetical protein
VRSGLVRSDIDGALIGTSDWTHGGWRGRFYPESERRKDWLAYYATRFPTTEINGPFYRTPSLEAVRAWRDDTPDDFLFAWKASKFITHWKRLSDKCDNSIALMETWLSTLAPKIAAVLYQQAGVPSRPSGREQNKQDSRCEFAASNLGGRGALLFASAEEDHVGLLLVLGFVTDAQPPCAQRAWRKPVHVPVHDARTRQRPTCS